MPYSIAPAQQKERIDILDSLRGVAILGILLLNIPSMGYSIIGRDPFVLNETGINYQIWFCIDWIVDGSQRALFSMLFGAGIILFMNSKSKQNNIVSASDYFFRRQLWLIFFGLINIYIFLWHGDILFDYGIYGLLIFVFRLWQPKKLLIAAGVCFVLMLARENKDLYLDKQMIARGEIIEKLDTSIVKLSEIQKDQLDEMQSFRNKTKPENRVKRIERAKQYIHSSYSNVYDFSVNRYLSNILNYSYFSVWDVLLFMFIGMALFKTGILTGNGSFRLYSILCIGGLSIGLITTYFHLKAQVDVQYNWFELTKAKTFSYFEVGRTLRTLGIFGLLMLLYKSGWFHWFFKLMQPVGQMAFTNYLTQSIIGAVIFTGIGFGYFGKLHRYEVYCIVLCIWLLQIIWSHVWLRYFQYGPFEWIWRQLTYWKKLPLRK